MKHVVTCCMLLPAVMSECREERVCLPHLSLFVMCVDIIIFTGHLLLGLFEPTYRKDFPVNNFWLVLVFWSAWNLLSHPFWRENVVDLFVVWPPEVHLMLNVAAVMACSSSGSMLPSWRHLTFLVIGEFLLSLALSGAEAVDSVIEALDRHAWIDAVTVRVDLVIFNAAILVIGSTVVFGSMTTEKDWKAMTAGELESGLLTQAVEDDLERRKRAVLTALCDTVLTTNAHFAISASNETADRMFKRSMLHEIFTDYLKDQAEKEKFMSSVKKQFPEDDSMSDGPKRLRVTLRDATGKTFDADVVVSDASTDQRTGKVNKLMVGMHIREGMRQRARPVADFQQPGQSVAGSSAGGLCNDSLPGTASADSAAANDSLRHGAGSSARDRPGGEEHHRQLQATFSQQLLAVFTETLRPADLRPCEASANGARENGPAAGSTSEKPGSAPPLPPRILLRRANCESFRRRTLPGGVRSGERHVDLRRLSLSDPTSGGTT